MRLLWAPIALGASFAGAYESTTNETAWCKDHAYLPQVPVGFKFVRMRPTVTPAPVVMDEHLASGLAEKF